jgi:hypothetical protein
MKLRSIQETDTLKPTFEQLGSRANKPKACCGKYLYTMHGIAHWYSNNIILEGFLKCIVFTYAYIGNVFTTSYSKSNPFKIAPAVILGVFV